MSIVEKRYPLGVYRMSPKQFQRACAADVYGEDRVELLAGIPFIMTKNPPHEVVTALLSAFLRSIVSTAGLEVFEEKSARLGSWRPIPDLMLVRGPLAHYFRKLPGPAEIALIVEVADTTYAKDRGLKSRQYAASGIPAYWIVNLDERRIEVCSDPTGRGRASQYRSCLAYLESDRVPILGASLVVGAILPPVAADEGSAEGVAPA
jgi:Uma2 family endonuclease